MQTSFGKKTRAVTMFSLAYAETLHNDVQFPLETHFQFCFNLSSIQQSLLMFIAVMFFCFDFLKNCGVFFSFLLYLLK